jgi:protein gp37
MAKRLQAMGRKEYAGLLDESGHWNGQVRIMPERLEAPLRWKRPRRVFVDSMSDLFHEDVPFDLIDKVFAVMGRSQHHTYMILTKRPWLMIDYFQSAHLYHRILQEAYKLDGQYLIRGEGMGSGISDPTKFPLPNIWLGVSVENQAAADERIPHLLDTPAAVRFVSCEPLLGPVDLQLVIKTDTGGAYGYDALTGRHFPFTLEPVNGHKLDWVICGGESGPGARPMHPDWARSLRDQCQAAKVPFFFKQWGEWLPVVEQYDDDDLMDKLDFEAHTICLGNRGTVFSEDRGLESVYWCGYQPDPGENPWFLERVGKKAAGRELDGRTWEEYPEVRR